MATAIRSALILELSQAAYDEIEEKLLEAGYDHLFWRGPGSAIDMSAISVVRQSTNLKVDPAVMANLGEEARKLFADTDKILRTMAAADAVYCFMCDTVVDKRCDRENCLHAANERVRTDLGLDKHP